MPGPNGFVKLELASDARFDELATTIDLDAVTDGRQGNHLTRPDERGVPLVRTTTPYPRPPHRFAPAHDRLVEQIRSAAAGAGLDLGARPFNHALVEIYDHRYRKMAFHSDQSLDLDPASTIAIVSCYLGPSGVPLRASPTPDVRQLVVKGKQTDERLTLSLDHGSVVLFSVATNARYLHKIVLPGGSSENVRWLGLTLRCAKTHLAFRDGEPHLPDGSPLTLADQAQRRVFYRLRGLENRSTAFAYPELSYTLSEGDLMPPVSDR